MIKMTIFYPNDEGKIFDMDYYVNSHIPMVMEKLGGAFQLNSLKRSFIISKWDDGGFVSVMHNPILPISDETYQI